VFSSFLSNLSILYNVRKRRVPFYRKKRHKHTFCV